MGTTEPLAAWAALPDLGDPALDERIAIERLLAMAPPATVREAAARRALRYIAAVRSADPGWLSAQNLLASFPLASREGVALLRLAEALLRAPDPETQTWLIAEKLAAFRAAAPAGDGLVQRVLAGALRLAGHTTEDAELAVERDAGGWRQWLSRTALRPMVIEGIRQFGQQFVFAQDLPRALDRAAHRAEPRETCSYDMLGEGARCAADARRNLEAYAQAIGALRERGGGDWRRRDGISVKLSAIHPRFETLQIDRVHGELYGALLELARVAAAADINFTIDAEESERLALHIALLDRLMREPALAGWEGLGLAVQAYQPRAVQVVEHLVAASRTQRRPLAVRLVKGAYWDAEIKRAQELGLSGFPVYTHKWATDLAYVALAARLLAADAPIYPQFATHNALTVATLIELARAHPGRAFELQRLHGMGAPMAAAVLAEERGLGVRVYAPVGTFRELLAYLVRRLLENGANSSFVHQISDAATDPHRLVADPVEQAQRALAGDGSLPALPTGAQLFGARRNSHGIDIQHAPTLLRLLRAAPPALAASPAAPASLAAPAAPDASTAARLTEIRNPAALGEVVGWVREADVESARDAVGRALAAFPRWDALGHARRAQVLETAAARVEAMHDALVALLQREAGKTLLDAHLELREAVDFLRYYAQQARALGAPRPLPGPAGESNELRLAGRGVFVAISPWNFPLAIFVGQVAAALAMGNAVIAKPAEQTPLVAKTVLELLHDAGVEPDAAILVPGRGETVGAALTDDPRIAGVVFTGSTATARAIHRSLAARDAPIGVLIAETGGQNAMVVDSTALPEQVCDAVIASAFRSAGQRCSALRVLCVQDEVADTMLGMIAGAMAELRIGDPRDARTDVGPVIDAAALAALEAQRDWLRAHARRIHECELPPGLDGHYFAPVAYELDSLAQLVQEHFGPILHVVRFDKRQFDGLLDEINATGFGLTCGLHTRLDARVAQVAARVRAGNLYVNRNMIGAVVGSQPFGGEGLSGTGPKAGGPHYLLRFATERVVTINTAAAGGNIDLVAGSAPAA